VAGWTGAGRVGLAVSVVSKPPTPRRAIQLAEIVYILSVGRGCARRDPITEAITST
jgi:hypothetical protein